ncbi:MAG TPA: MFS transporter [Bacteroidetes bacterium]|nr:MFS transporter [Bacteroidota bacterium]
MPARFRKDLQYYKFSLYGFLKNLKFFDPFLLLFFLEKGLGYPQIGTLYAIREVTRNIFEVPSGILADAMGRRKAMIACFMFYIASFVVFGLTSGFAAFIGAMLLFSLGDALRTGTHKAMIFEYLRINGWEDQKTHYYGHTRGWSQMGSALSSLLAALIVFHEGSYQSVFLYSTIPYVLDMLLMISYPSVLDGKERGAGLKDIGKNYKKVVGQFVHSFRNPAVLGAILNVSSFSGYYKAVKDYLQPFIRTFALGLPLMVGLEDKQRAAMLVGVFYFILYFLTSFASRSSGKVTERVGRIGLVVNLTLIAGVAAGMLSGLFYELGMVLLAIFFYFLVFILENLRKPAGIAYVSEKLDQDILASALSAESQAETLFAALLALVLGFCAEWLGVGYGLMVTSVLILLVFPLIMGFISRQRKRTRQT